MRFVERKSFKRIQAGQKSFFIKNCFNFRRVDSMRFLRRLKQLSPRQVRRSKTARNLRQLRKQRDIHSSSERLAGEKLQAGINKISQWQLTTPLTETARVEKENLLFSVGRDFSAAESLRRKAVEAKKGAAIYRLHSRLARKKKK